MQLYSYNGEKPQKLPFSLRLNGRLRTDVENQLTEEELNSIGWYIANVGEPTGTAQWWEIEELDTPIFDEQTKEYTFSYTIIDKGLEEVKQIKLKELEDLKDTYIANNFGEEDQTLRIINLYKAFGRLLNIIVTENNIKTAVTNDQLLINTYNLSQTLTNYSDLYKTKKQEIQNATTVAEVVAINLQVRVTEKLFVEKTLEEVKDIQKARVIDSAKNKVSEIMNGTQGEIQLEAIVFINHLVEALKSGKDINKDSFIKYTTDRFSEVKKVVQRLGEVKNKIETSRDIKEIENIEL